MANVPKVVLIGETLLSLYRQMLRIRLCEERLAEAQQQGLIPGECHTCIGQEAIAVGVCRHLNDQDVIYSTHRGHGHALAKGLSAHALMAELYGRATGCCGGRGGGAHLYAPEVGLLGTDGAAGSSILQAVGAGYSFRLRGSDRVAVAFFGESSVLDGAFHEGLNMAVLWQLPVLFVCENNHYVGDMPFKQTVANARIAVRGKSYALPSVSVDGSDVTAVYGAAFDAVRRARSGEGPSLLVCQTFRVHAHSEGMLDQRQISEKERQTWQERDPIRLLYQRLSTDHVVAVDDLQAVRREVEREVQEAHQSAERSPWPNPATVTVHVYCQEDEPDA